MPVTKIASRTKTDVQKEGKKKILTAEGWKRKKKKELIDRSKKKKK